MNYKNIFMVGIKGTGMAALAELLTKQGYCITGSDVPQVFFTDTILNKAGIKFVTSFKSENITKENELVIYSSAYNPNTNPELLRAKELGIPTMIYTEALGYISSLSYSVGIAGIHGKTTTTAITGTIIKELDLDASTLVGSGVSSFNGSAINVKGNKYFIAETCEYHRHFLAFHPNIILITSIEMDHPDYFKSLEDINDAFISYINLLPKEGTLIYCADDLGAINIYNRAKKIRKDLNYIGYGQNATGKYKITSFYNGNGQNNFTLLGFPGEFSLRIPGHHTMLDSVGSIAIANTLLENEYPSSNNQLETIKSGLLKFKGTKRRTEIIGEKNGVLFIDDYGHHPTAIETTLKGYKEFYPNRRIIVDFMSHTYTRTSQLLKEFSKSFSSADIVILNKIYSSAREEYNGNITGETLFYETVKNHNCVYYCPEYNDAVIKAKEILKPGDIFVTMGAGNNWQVGETLLKEF